ncbi:unnamed protein product [Amoebophrya sp. A25]|nr:unnamed protein product [Amoebophrya sp. A25]|eukprot:GSA25T00013858001.1
MDAGAARIQQRGGPSNMRKISRTQSSHMTVDSGRESSYKCGSCCGVSFATFYGTRLNDKTLLLGYG